MRLTDYIAHPEQMDRESLFELRSQVARYPYFQTARLLMLHNLFLLHDPTFDEELRKAAIYITDRKVLFQLIEASHYQLRSQKNETSVHRKDNGQNRTISLIDNFLDSIPNEQKEVSEKSQKTPKRMPTPADAAIDYVAYLMESEAEAEHSDEIPQLKGQNLIDSFIQNDRGKIVLNEIPTLKPELSDSEQSDGKGGDEGYFTETLARIYIKQGRYSKALEIIRRLSLQYPKKNAYFADQIRFLEKLIINNNKK